MISRCGDEAQDDGRRGHAAIVAGAAVIVVLAGAGGLIHHFGSLPDERAAGGDWGSPAFALLVLTPAVLAVIGARQRPWILVATGLLLLPMCFLSFSFLFFPLVIPAGLFFSVAVARPRRTPHPHAQVIAAMLVVGLVIAAALSLFAHPDPITWSTATSSGNTSDVITRTEALTSFGFLVAAVAIAALAPPDGTSRQARRGATSTK